jgi:hypothetical protein
MEQFFEFRPSDEVEGRPVAGKRQTLLDLRQMPVFARKFDHKRLFTLLGRRFLWSQRNAFLDEQCVHLLNGCLVLNGPAPPAPEH